MLYVYSYAQVLIWQQCEKLKDFKANVLWIKKNGAYTGE